MRLLRLAKDNYNAGSVLKSSIVERQIFPEPEIKKKSFLW
jgi:hypothetical protein